MNWVVGWLLREICVQNVSRRLRYHFICLRYSNYGWYFHPGLQQPLVSQGLLIIEGSRLSSDTTHSVGLLWKSDQPNEETSTLQHIIIRKDRRLWPRQHSNPQSQMRAAAKSRLRPRGHWNRPPRTIFWLTETGRWRQMVNILLYCGIIDVHCTLIDWLDIYIYIYIYIVVWLLYCIACVEGNMPIQRMTLLQHDIQS
jgi:hypothetical protein